MCLTPLAAWPPAEAAGVGRPGTPERRETMSVILGLSLVIGVAVGPFAGALPALAPGLFTSDAALWPLMRSVAPQARSLAGNAAAVSVPASPDAFSGRSCASCPAQHSMSWCLAPQPQWLLLTPHTAAAGFAKLL